MIIETVVKVTEDDMLEKAKKYIHKYKEYYDKPSRLSELSVSQFNIPMDILRQRPKVFYYHRDTKGEVHSVRLKYAIRKSETGREYIYDV